MLCVSVLEAGYAALAIAVISVEVSWINHTFSWILLCSRTGCCNDSRQCHAKDFIL